MCGIAGAFGFIDDRVRNAVTAMHAAQRHRGPDGDGVWSHVGRDQQGIILAHRRLAILDLSELGAQPMADPATGNVICYNGEVYNFKDIRTELESLGHQFASECDTEVILKAYAQWGIECVCRFRGMFGFALWNKSTGQMHLVRDRLGIKPVYYAMVDNGAGGKTLLFASELRSLLASELVQRKICPHGLASYLWHGFVVGPHTLVRDIRLLPTGTSATVHVNDVAVSPEKYWKLPSARRGDMTREHLRRELEAAAGMRLISDVPLGIFLSGGIDSSAVTALAVRHASGPVHTFSIGFEEADFDESKYAVAVAQGLGTEHTQLQLKESHFKAHLPDALAGIDQPTFDAINTYFVSRAVREAGVTVALAGTGGDELFGGYRSFVDLPKAIGWGKRLRSAPQPLLSAAVKTVTRFKTGAAGDVPPQTRWGKLGDALSARGDLVHAYQVAYGLFTSEFIAQLSATAAPQNFNFGLESSTAAELSQLIDGEPVLHAISMLELRSFIGERLLRDTDAASMAVSLEVRVPLLDHAVVETIAGVDESARFQPLRRKQLLKDLALNELDPAIFDREKSGFVFPFDRWCRQGLRGELDAAFADKDRCESVGLNGETVAKLWKGFQAGAPGLYWSRVWSLFVLLDWCRRHDVTV